MPSLPPPTAPTVRLSIDAESAHQVRPTEVVDAVPLAVRAVRPGAVELVGPYFLPRRCGVLVAFDDAALAAVPGAGLAGLTGEVRRVQMVGPEPTYVLTVQLPEATPDELAALRELVER